MSYTNVAGGVLSALRDLVIGEFGGKVLVLWGQAEDVSRAPEWFEVRLVSSAAVEPMQAFAEVRRYAIQIIYLRRVKPAEDDLRTQMQRLEVVQRMQRLLVDSSHLTDAGTYVWHDGQVGEIVYSEPMTERADDNLVAARIEWACSVTEIIS